MWYLLSKVPCMLVVQSNNVLNVQKGKLKILVSCVGWSGVHSYQPDLVIRRQRRKEKCNVQGEKVISEMISSRKHLGAKLLNSSSKLGKFLKNHNINSLNVRIQQCHSFVSFIFNFKKLPLYSQYFVFVICFAFLILVSVHFRYICIFKSYFFIEFL